MTHISQLLCDIEGWCQWATFRKPPLRVISSRDRWRHVTLDGQCATPNRKPPTARLMVTWPMTLRHYVTQNGRNITPVVTFVPLLATNNGLSAEEWTEKLFPMQIINKIEHSSGTDTPTSFHRKYISSSSCIPAHDASKHILMVDSISKLIREPPAHVGLIHRTSLLEWWTDGRTNWQTDGRTDGGTDGHVAIAISRASIASRG